MFSISSPAKRGRRPPKAVGGGVSRPTIGILAAIALATALPAPAEPVTPPDDGLHGRLELQDLGDVSAGNTLQAALGAKAADDAAANLRLAWAPSLGAWKFTFDYLLSAEAGGDVPLTRLQNALIPAPPATWWPLTSTLADRGHVLATGSVDRLALAWSSPDLVVRLGRQALTWGSGLVFQPMDLFDPFSPSALDTEYKPGSDMAYVQKLFADGSDLQLVVVPRPPRAGSGLTVDASSAALQLHTVLFGHRTTWMLARDHGDWTGAFGLNGALGGATWNVELVPTGLATGATKLSALANISDTLTFLKRNTTVFAEYFHNGFGVAGGPFDLANLPADLTGRLARGQVFSLRQDYLAGGASLEISPLVTAGPSLIVDADDGSLLLLASASWSLGDNLTLIGGVQAPLGADRTEFGGLPLSPGSPVRLAAPRRIYIQLRRYF